MPIPKQYIKTFELNKDDLANIHGRLKSADYFTMLAIADCVDYLRKVVLRRMGLPENWVITHDDDWTKITVVDPNYADEYSKSQPSGIEGTPAPEK